MGQVPLAAMSAVPLEKLVDPSTRAPVEGVPLTFAPSEAGAIELGRVEQQVGKERGTDVGGNTEFLPYYPVEVEGTLAPEASVMGRV